MRPISNSNRGTPQADSGSHPYLREGAQGEDVRELQQKLQDDGIDCGPVDGIFGPKTLAAVKRFQQANGLGVDGIVGPQTWAALGAPARPTTLPVMPQPAPSQPQGSSSVSSTAPQSTFPFINQIAQGAVDANRKYGVPASVTIAQAILESNWGKSGLSQQAHNLFGIKGSGTAGSVTMPTKEFLNGQWVTINAAFRAYNTDAESLEDHAKLLAQSGYYKKAMANRNDPRAFANALTGVYATAPNYGESLIRIMNQYNLYRYDVPTSA